MLLRLAALSAFAVASCVHAQAPSPAQTLTLDEAIARVAATHPDLRLVQLRREVLDAERQLAGFRPPVTVGADLSNVAGSGPYAGTRRAELSVSLAGVLERGGKLDARRTLAQANLDAAAPQREIARLDLLAETARRYLAITAAVREREIAEVDIEQRRRAVEAARRRLEAGASPESSLLTAQAALAQAELDRDRARQSEQAARQHLAALWNDREAQFGTVTGDPLALPELLDVARLGDLLDRTPELAMLAGQERVREAQLQLAQTQARADLQWQVGVRSFAQGSDAALFGGVAMPLGAAARAAPVIRSAELMLRASPAMRQALVIQLYSTLAAAHGTYRTAQLEVVRLGEEVLPRLARAEQAADAAWRRGAISYLEWSQLQSLRIQARQRQLQAGLQAQTALIEIQRLTGQSALADTDDTQEPSP